MKNTAQRKKNIAGYRDELGIFRPIRSGADYSPIAAGDGKSRLRRKAGARTNLIAAAKKAKDRGQYNRVLNTLVADHEMTTKGAKRLIGEFKQPKANPSGLHIVQITPKTYGVFLNKYLLQRFRTKTAASLHLRKLQAKVKKNPATAAQLAKTAIGIFDANSDGKVTRKDVRILRKAAPKKKAPMKSRAAPKRKASVKRKVARRNPIHPITAFAAGASGILSALQIKAMVSKRKARSGTTTAKRKNPAKNPPSSGDAFTQTIKFANGKVRSVNVIDAKSGELVARYKTLTAAKSFATKNGIRLEVNPKTNGIASRFIARRKAKREYGKELRLKAAIERSRSRRRKAESKAKANPKKAKNPKTTTRRRTYEMFQGRKPEKVTELPISRFAPARVDQLGELVELKLNGGQVLKFNGNKFRLCAANGRLWIAGGRFAKPSPSEKTNVINPVAEIDHVVYRTFKPHHGDPPRQQYIHRMGEETGHRPILAVDREGFPVIRGGKYKIEARGIVN